MKRFIVVILVVASMICFMGCESADNNDIVVGTWQLVSETIEGEKYEEQDMPVNMRLMVNNDGSFVVENQENGVTTNYNGTWEKDDYFYTFDMMGSKQTMVISSGRLKCIVDTENNYIYEKR